MFDLYIPISYKHILISLFFIHIIFKYTVSLSGTNKVTAKMCETLMKPPPQTKPFFSDLRTRYLFSYKMIHVGAVVTCRAFL